MKIFGIKKKILVLAVILLAHINFAHAINPYFGASFNIDQASSFGFNDGPIRWGINPFIGISFEDDWLMLQLEAPIEIGSFSDKNIGISRIAPELRSSLSFFSQSFVRPFVGIGLGYSVNLKKDIVEPQGLIFSTNFGALWNIPKTGLAFTTDAKLRVHILDFAFGWSVDAGLKYTFGKYRTEKSTKASNKATQTTATKTLAATTEQKKGYSTFDPSKVPNIEKHKFYQDDESQYIEFADGFYFKQNKDIKDFKETVNKELKLLKRYYDEYYYKNNVYTYEYQIGNNFACKAISDTLSINIKSIYKISSASLYNQDKNLYVNANELPTQSASSIIFEATKSNIQLYKDVFSTDNVVFKTNIADADIKLDNEQLYLVRRYLYLIENYDDMLERYMTRVEAEKIAEEERVNKIIEEVKEELKEFPQFYDNGFQKGLQENFEYAFSLQKESEYQDFKKNRAKHNDFESWLPEYTSYYNKFDIYSKIATELFEQGEKDGAEEWVRRIRASSQFTEREKECILKKQIFVGMSEEALLKSWGKPEHINTSVYSWGTHKQYVYGYDYVYVESGKITSYQLNRRE